MEITLEAVEKVMGETGVEFAAAKEALQKADGDAEKAILLLQPKEKAEREKVDRVLSKIKEKVAEGNVSRIQLSRKGEILLTVPVNVGIVGGLIGMTAAPWALIAGAIAAYGFDCRIEIIKKDGNADEITPAEAEKDEPEKSTVSHAERIIIDDDEV